MGLADRVGALVEQPYARYNIRTWDDVFPKPNTLAPRPSLKASLLPTQSDQESKIADIGEEVLMHFGIPAKLGEIRDKYWQTGTIYKLRNGYVLTDGFEEPVPRSKPEYFRGASFRDTWVDSPVGTHGRWKHTPSIQPGWDMNTKWHTRAVRHTLIAQVVQIPSADKVAGNEHEALVNQFLSNNQADLPSQVGVLLALDVHPRLYLERAQDRSIAASRGRINAIDIITAMSSLQTDKYTGAKDRYAYGGAWDYEFWQDKLLKIKHPPYNASRDSRREFGRNQNFFPWSFWLNSSDTGNVDSFLAEYIIDLKFDLRPLVKIKEQVKQSIDMITNRQGGLPLVPNEALTRFEERLPFARRFLTPDEAIIYFATVGTKDYEPELYKDTIPPYRLP